MNDFLQLLVAGVAVGSLYALVALGFVVIYKATSVINFAQGSLAALGAYFTYQLGEAWGLAFWLAVPIAMVGAAVIGVLVERLILRRMVGQPVFAVIMITIGLTIVIDQILVIVWGGSNLDIGDPWGIGTVAVGDVVIAKVDIARLAVTAVLLTLFFLFFRFSKFGVAMRATAADQEAAMAQGIGVRQIYALAWGIAAACATVAGVMLASGGRGVEPTLGFAALVAFPAIILGGLDSTGGAIFGGLVIGIVEQMTAGYQRYLPDVLGTNFNVVTPYLVLVLILVARPHGLFGTKEVIRV